ncbi:hypothetical protein MMC12_005800 [Toensbergia leucococca]|nr:hypothetical protein [Toensbergia leucococca]
MRTLAWQALKVLPRLPSPYACRFVAHRRFPLPRRAFQSLAKLQSSQDDPEDKAGPAWNHGTDDSPSVPPKDEGAQAAEYITETTETPTKSEDRSSYGSAHNRSERNVKKPTRKPPKVPIPQWFLERNVSLRDAGLNKNIARLVTYSKFGKSLVKDDVSSSVEDVGITETSASAGASIADSGKAEEHPTNQLVSETASPELVNDKNYEIDSAILREISLMVSTGLRPPTTQYADTFLTSTSNVILHCPKEGGIFFLESVVRHLAAVNDADLIRIDAQDFAEIGGKLLGKSSDGHRIDLLGYDTHLTTDKREFSWHEEAANEEEYDDAEDEEDDQGNKSPGLSLPSSAAIDAMRNATTTLRHISRFINKLRLGAGSIESALVVSNPSSQSIKAFPPARTSIYDIKISHIIEAMLNASESKRRIFSKNNDPDSPPAVQESANANTNDIVTDSHNAFVYVDPTSPKPSPQHLIVMIQDYLQIGSTLDGEKVIATLLKIVQKRRKEGQRILLIGTTSSEDIYPSLSKSGFQNLQSEVESGPTRTIITPCRASSDDRALLHDGKLRTKQINLRHIQDMVRRLGLDDARIKAVVSQQELEIDSVQAYATGLDESIWAAERIHRIVTIALGLLEEGEDMNTRHLDRALELIELSDNAKFDWIDDEKKQAKEEAKMLNTKRTHLTTQQSITENKERMVRLRKTCNSYEKKLLSGVINPESIRTTFADVRASPETIDALKTLTSLSLTRPEAFTYGVLATDKIPGLLLYGPPGTGKTLLAKAVAKESGATVLEISGSDVYDMYVGQAEKNVRAVFSLAKKLTPCIVFIDEADAILGSRSNSVNRNSHRELINQFLREWDGMNDLSAFIMVATNRPFDLDDAVLRRLPRRLLVDLPLEPDRAAILRIHLKDEILDPAVSLEDLASQTPFYSGSDLKNFAVAAALACVRDENDQAAAALHHQIFPSLSEEPYKHPEKRTLLPKHFARAMEEISASISEDMGSLSAIRKFDEKYGDRRGRKKKGGGYGFQTVTEAERNVLESARVRKWS